VLRGADPCELDTTPIPNSGPCLFPDENGKPLRSSEGDHQFLPRVSRASCFMLCWSYRREVMSISWSMSTSVVSPATAGSGPLVVLRTEALARMVLEPFCRHQGRWGPNACEPRNMEVKYRQPLLRELLTVSDHGHTWCHAHTLQFAVRWCSLDHRRSTVLRSRLGVE
jgi:hypothetical protein